MVSSFLENEFIFTIFVQINCRFLRWNYFIFFWHKIIRYICQPVIFRGISIKSDLQFQVFVLFYIDILDYIDIWTSIIPRLKDSKFSIIQHDRHNQNPFRLHWEWNLKSQFRKHFLSVKFCTVKTYISSDCEQGQQQVKSNLSNSRMQWENRHSKKSISYLWDSIDEIWISRVFTLCCGLTNSN